MKLTRRRLLATGASLSLAETAGCLGLLDRKPLVLRAMPAGEHATQSTDVQCRLSKPFVSNHPRLRNVLRRAHDNQRGSWAKTGITEYRAATINDALVDHCGENDVRGIYRYDGKWFYISMAYRQASDHDHGSHDHSSHNHSSHTHSSHNHSSHTQQS